MNDELLDLIKKENFKVCFDKIKVLSRQYPNSTYLKVVELYAKHKQSPTKFNCDDSLINVYGSQGSIITSDLSALNLLHKFFFELGKYEEALQVFERANFKYPSFNLAISWFTHSLNDLNFRQVIRASQKLAKLSADGERTLTSRDYFFWYALSILAFFKFYREKVTDQEFKVLPQLAYRTMCNLKPFQTTQELIVFCSVCEQLFPNDSQKSEEIVKEILPCLDDSLDLYLKNFLVHHIKDDDHETIFNVCCKILSKIDDYELISLLIKSGHHLGKSKIDIEENIESLVGDSRNSRLSRLEADRIFDATVSNSSLQHYLSRFHDRPCCAIDINRYIDIVDFQSLQVIMSDLSNQNAVHDANAFKLKLIDQDAVSLYKSNKASLKSKPKTDYSTCSQFILSKVQSILLKNKNVSSLEDVLLALSILENYQKMDPHNYDTGVWILLLYMHLGCVPLAFSRYLELKTKNVQIDTVDFLVYSRYSTLYPSKDSDFLKNMSKAHDRFYGSSVKRLSQFIQIALEKKAYSKILGMIEFQSKLQRSSMRWMMTYEKLQLARLCNDKRTELLQTMHQDLNLLEAEGSLQLSDNRDWSVFGSCASQKGTLSVFRVLNVSDEAIILNCIKELLVEVIPSRQKDEKLDKLLERVLDGRDLQQVLECCLDNTSRWAFNVLYDIYRNNGTNLRLYLEQIESRSHFISTWELSHKYLTHMQILKTLDNFKRIKDVEIKKLIKAKMKELRQDCDDFYRAYIAELSKACESISGSETLKILGFEPMDFKVIKDSILSVQKTSRNL